MIYSVKTFSDWQEKMRALAEVRGWLKHIGAQGRNSDVLQISPAHCTAPGFTVAGQYTTGGTNYWESSKSFDEAMKAVILSRFTELAAEAVSRLEKEAAAKLVAAESEIAAIQCAIEEAKSAA